MNPTRQQVYVNRTLENYSLMMLQEDGFVADDVFKVLPVDKPTGLYFTYNRGDFNRPQVVQRGVGMELPSVDYGITATANFYTQVKGLRRDIDDQIMAAADSAINLELEATKLLTLQMRLDKETNWANQFFVSGVWSTQWAGVSSAPSTSQFLQWNNSSATPIEDIRNVIRAMIQTSGNVVRNKNLKLILGKQVYDTLLGVPEITSRVLYGQKSDGNPAMVNQNDLAQLFEVGEVLVSTVTQNNVVSGATENEQFVLGKSALLAYVPDTVSLYTPAAGFNFSWTEYAGAAGRWLSYPWLPTRSTRIEFESAYQYNLVSADLGAFFETCIA